MLSGSLENGQVLVLPLHADRSLAPDVTLCLELIITGIGLLIVRLLHVRVRFLVLTTKLKDSIVQLCDAVR